MKNALFRYPLAGVLAASAFVAQSATAQAQPIHYTITDLGAASGSTPGQPLVIKDTGLIGGGVNYLGVAWHAALSFFGIQIDLAKSGGLGGQNSSAYDVNQLLQAVGNAETKNPDPKLEDFCTWGTQQGCEAFIWQNGVMSALAPLKDASGAAGHNSFARAIDASGRVAGYAENTTADSTCPPYNPTANQFQFYQVKPVIWENGEPQPLPTSGNDVKGKAFNDPDGYVFSMNDSGQAVGATGTCAGSAIPSGAYLNSLHMTLWQNGSVVDLGNLGSNAPGSGAFAGFANVAYAINQWGHVIGTSGRSDGSFHAFFWSPETLMQDLGTLQGDIGSVGLAISDNGDIGGLSIPANPNAPLRAFLRPDGGTMVDVNSLIPVDSPLYLFSVCSVNSRGELIGLALDDQGNFHGYLATPSNGQGDPPDATASAMRSARFADAWRLAGQRIGSAFGSRR